MLIFQLLDINTGTLTGRYNEYKQKTAGYKQKSPVACNPELRDDSQTK
jgi:hypothetical protein